MTTTLADLLFEPHADAAAELAGALAATPAALAGLSVAGISIPTVEVANAIATLLELPIGNLAVKGWNDHRTIVDARRRTAASPGSREVIRLLEHRIATKQEPVIEADVNGVSIPLFALTLEVEIRISSLDVIVEHGQAVDTRPGSAVAAGTLSASKVVLAKKAFRPVDLRRRPTTPPVEPPPTGLRSAIPPPPAGLRSAIPPPRRMPRPVPVPPPLPVSR